MTGPVSLETRHFFLILRNGMVLIHLLTIFGLVVLFNYPLYGLCWKEYYVSFFVSITLYFLSKRTKKVFLEGRHQFYLSLLYGVLLGQVCSLGSRFGWLMMFSAFRLKTKLQKPLVLKEQKQKRKIKLIRA